MRHAAHRPDRSLHATMLTRASIFATLHLAATTAAATPYVLVPDTSNGIITAFRQSNGAQILVENKPPGLWLDLAMFIDSGSLGILRHAAQVGSEIWISDQLNGIVHRVSAEFETPRYLGFIDSVPNPRGVGTSNAEAWIASGSIGPSGGLARFTFNGQPLGSFDADDPFDFMPLGTGFLTANIFNNRLDFFSAAGVFQNVWSATSTLDFPLQITSRTTGSGTEIVVAGNADPQPGLYRFDAASGAFLGRTLTIAFLPFITVTQPRGTAVLGTGELLWSSTQGVFAVNPGTGISRTLYTGENFVCNMADTVDFSWFCQGDLNNDAFVDDSDFSAFAIAYDLLLCPQLSNGFPAGCPADLNGDGFVDDADFTYFARAYDKLLCPLSP